MCVYRRILKVGILRRPNGQKWKKSTFISPRKLTPSAWRCFKKAVTTTKKPFWGQSLYEVFLNIFEKSEGFDAEWHQVTWSPGLNNNYYIETIIFNNYNNNDFALGDDPFLTRLRAPLREGSFPHFVGGFCFFKFETAHTQPSRPISLGHFITWSRGDPEN